MEEKIIEAFKEMKNEDYQSVVEISNSYTQHEILETYLEYEGIIGYANQIIDLLNLANDKQADVEYEIN